MRLTIETLELHFHHEFRIARGGSAGTSTLLVALETDDGRRGLGEAVPVRYYGWTLDSMRAALEAMGEWLADRDPDPVHMLAAELEARHADQRAAVAAVVSALWDLAGQALGAPVHRLLGVDASAAGLTSFTLGLAPLDEMLAKADEAAQYPILKVKCGSPDDLATVRALAEHTGKRLWVDANGGWSAEDAAGLSRELEALGVELIEQPVPREDLDGLAAVRAVSPLPIVADESCHTPEDVVALRDRVDGVNIKLEKFGGISAGLRAIHTARACGLRVMLGCFCASSVALTGAAQLAPLVDWADLDGHLLVADDPYRGMTAPAGRITLPTSPGLGVQPAD